MWRFSFAVSTCNSFKALLHAECGGRKCVAAAWLVTTLQEGESGPRGHVDTYFALVPQMLGSHYPSPFLIMYFFSSFVSLQSIAFG